MDPNLSTTNILLAIMAAVSVLEAVAVIGLLAAGFMLYRRLVRMLAMIGERHIVPAALRINGILDDVKGVTAVAHAAARGAESGSRIGLAWLLRRLRRFFN